VRRGVTDQILSTTSLVRALLQHAREDAMQRPPKVCLPFREADRRRRESRSRSSAFRALSTAIALIVLGLPVGSVDARGTKHASKSAAAPARAGQHMSFRASGYSQHGETAGGTRPREGIVAADNHVLPLGTRIRMVDAGPYSGEYVVKDKGRKIHGHKLDVSFDTRAEARKFGKRTVKVEVISVGEGTRSDAQQEPIPPPENKAPALK